MEVHILRVLDESRRLTLIDKQGRKQCRTFFDICQKGVPNDPTWFQWWNQIFRRISDGLSQQVTRNTASLECIHLPYSGFSSSNFPLINSPFCVSKRCVSFIFIVQPKTSICISPLYPHPHIEYGLTWDQSTLTSLPPSQFQSLSLSNEPIPSLCHESRPFQLTLAL